MLLRLSGFHITQLLKGFFGTAVSILLLLVLSVHPVSAKTHVVKMGTDRGILAFEPSTLTIEIGDTVKWINNRAFPHNVVFDRRAPDAVRQHSQKRLLASPSIEITEIFDDVPPGKYTYHCLPHRGGGMSATLIVRE